LSAGSREARGANAASQSKPKTTKNNDDSTGDAEALRVLGEATLLSTQPARSVAAYEKAIAIDDRDQQILTVSGGGGCVGVSGGGGFSGVVTPIFFGCWWLRVPPTISTPSQPNPT